MPGVSSRSQSWFYAQSCLVTCVQKIAANATTVQLINPRCRFGAQQSIFTSQDLEFDLEPGVSEGIFLRGMYRVSERHAQSFPRCRFGAQDSEFAASERWIFLRGIYRAYERYMQGF
jgi:hypothetical protein